MISKIYKKNNKKGFTLTEIIIVVAIIVILAGAGLTGVLVSIHDYNVYKQNLEENGGYQFEADARTAIENLIKGGGTYKPRTIKLNDPPTEPASATPTPGGGGGDTPTDPTDPTSPTAPTDTEPSSSSSQTEPTSTSAQTPDPALPSNNGGGGGGGGIPTPPIVTSGKGVYGFTKNGDKTTVITGNDPWNKARFTITGSSGNYTLTFNDGDGFNKYTVDQNVFPDLWKNQPYTLNSNQKNYLKNTYGLSID